MLSTYIYKQKTYYLLFILYESEPQVITLMDYKCSNLSDIDNEIIALDRISGTLLAKEAQLSNSCWFDYRLLHPTQRTYLFAHYYEKAYRFMLRLHVDYEQAEGDNPRSYLPKEDPLGKTKAQLLRDKRSGITSAFRTTTTVWKARQKADELCMPYEEFCMSGMKAAIGRIWQRTPNPAQLYSDNIVNLIIDRWAILATEQIFAAANSFYELKNWRNHPSQFEHAQWLISQIQCRVNPEMALAHYAFNRKMLPSQLLRSAFSEAKILSASRLSKSLL